MSPAPSPLGRVIVETKKNHFLGVLLTCQLYVYTVICLFYSEGNLMDLLSRVGMEYRNNEVPEDFPQNEATSASSRWGDWAICEELANEVARECHDARAAASRAERSVDILLRSYLKAEALGWGEPDELRWVFRRAAALLRWPEPDAVKHP